MMGFPLLPAYHYDAEAQEKRERRARAAREEERAAIVAFLRRRDVSSRHTFTADVARRTLDEAITAIERGDHHR